ncbi:hypothetical protein V8B97DRAFT_1659865 [Scleroderma yunnanense]
MDASKEPASGPQRDGSSSSVASPGPKPEREKRKRSRVTPEQLVHLERFFAMDRSPTAARRKEISDMLGMQERQTQIWFQNRRAKAKLQDGKKGRGESAESPPDTPPELATGYQAELHHLLHEDEPITIIPCTDLSIGTWRRIATTVGKHDLVAYLCDARRCLTWFIHSAGYGFKMEVPFDIIADTEFTNAAPGSGLVSFLLARPPTFYLETLSPPTPAQGTEPIRHWKQCADWTEGQQATKILRHDLVGSAVQLAHVLRHLNAHTSGSDIQLHSPSYMNHDTSPALLHDLAGSYSASGSTSRPSGSPIPIDTSSVSLTAPHQGQYGSTYPPYPCRQTSIQANIPPIYSDYSGSAASHNMHSAPQTPLGHEPCAYPPHGQPRPYSAGSSVGMAHTPLATPSPPILTTPFYPAGPRDSRPNTRSRESLDVPLPLLSGMPGATFHPDNNSHHRESRFDY